MRLLLNFYLNWISKEIISQIISKDAKISYYELKQKVIPHNLSFLFDAPEVLNADLEDQIEKKKLLKYIIKIVIYLAHYLI